MPAAGPGFPRPGGGGRAPTYYLAKFWWKLHENEENLAMREWGYPKFYYVDPPLLKTSIFTARKRSLGQGNIFTLLPPSLRHPTPPLPSRACWEIRSTSRQYASYWNAILSSIFLHTTEIRAMNKMTNDREPNSKLKTQWRHVFSNMSLASRSLHGNNGRDVGRNFKQIISEFLAERVWCK